MGRVVAGQQPAAPGLPQALDHESGLGAYGEQLSIQRVGPARVDRDEIAVVNRRLHRVARRLDARQAIRARPGRPTPRSPRRWIPPAIPRTRRRRCPPRAGRRARTGSSRQRSPAARVPASAHGTPGRASAPPPPPPAPAIPARGRSLRAVWTSSRPCRSPRPRRRRWRLEADPGPGRSPAVVGVASMIPPARGRCRAPAPGRTRSARGSCSAPPGPAPGFATVLWEYRCGARTVSVPPSRPAAVLSVAGNRPHRNVSLLTR